MKKLWLSKTFWVNVIGMIIAGLSATQDPDLLPYTAAGIAVANIILRLVTSEGIGWTVSE